MRILLVHLEPESSQSPRLWTLVRQTMERFGPITRLTYGAWVVQTTADERMLAAALRADVDLDVHVRRWFVADLGAEGSVRVAGGLDVRGCEAVNLEPSEAWPVREPGK